MNLQGTIHSCAWQGEKHAFSHLFHYEVLMTGIELMVLMWLVCCFLVKTSQIQFPIAFLVGNVLLWTREGDLR